MANLKCENYSQKMDAHSIALKMMTIRFTLANAKTLNQKQVGTKVAVKIAHKKWALKVSDKTVIFRVYADLWRDVKYANVSVRVSSTRTEMGKDMDVLGFGPHTNDCQGQCSGIIHYAVSGRRTGCFAIMWLNKEDLLKHGMELISHESVHAAMRHINNRKVDLSEMPGEEALAYTVGSLSCQINEKLHSMGIFN